MSGLKDFAVWDCVWALTGGGGLAGVDVSDDNDVDMDFLLTMMRVAC